MALKHMPQQGKLRRHRGRAVDPDRHAGDGFCLELRQHFDFAAPDLGALVSAVHGPGQSDHLFRHDQIGAVPVEIGKGYHFYHAM